jgi:hypothetical protein
MYALRCAALRSGGAHVAPHGHEGVHRVRLVLLALAAQLVLLDALYELGELDLAAAVLVNLGRRAGG